MNLPQLIEWAWENNITNQEFFCDGFKEKSVIFNLSGWAEFSDELSYNPHDTFTVEVEEELTEDTVLPKLIERWKHDGEGNEAFRYVEYDDKSINTVLFANPESVETTHFYIENDNQELVLIWRDGKLI